MITESTVTPPVLIDQPDTQSISTPINTNLQPKSTHDEHSTNLNKTQDSDSNIALFDSNSPDNPPEGLKQLLARVFPQDESRARDHAKVLMLVAAGVHTLDALDQCRMIWTNVSGVQCHSPLFCQAWMAARESGDTIRRAQAERALHKRGVEGWDEASYGKDGFIRKYSDKCLELYLRAEDPKKYGERTEKSGSGVVIQVNLGVNLGKLENAKVYDVSTAVSAPESVSEALPENTETPKT